MPANSACKALLKPARYPAVFHEYSHPPTALWAYTSHR